MNEEGTHPVAQEKRAAFFLVEALARGCAEIHRSFAGDRSHDQALRRQVVAVQVLRAATQR